MMIYYNSIRKGNCYTFDDILTASARKQLTEFAKALQDTGKPPQTLDGLTLIAEGVTDENVPYAEYK